MSGNRRVLTLERLEGGAMTIAAIFTDPTGARTRVLWIPDNKDIEEGSSFPKRHIVEIRNAEQLERLKVTVVVRVRPPLTPVTVSA